MAKVQIVTSVTKDEHDAIFQGFNIFGEGLTMLKYKGVLSKTVEEAYHLLDTEFSTWKIETTTEE